jgi:RNA-directed DNA polymerase
MKTYKHLWTQLTNYRNLEAAYEKAKKRKTRNPSVQEFSERTSINLALLKHELKTKTYRPRPLQRFILCDPKTRVISKSHFRDRVIHHALVNVLLPIFEPRFIHDSYASRKGKGTHNAIKRFDQFTRQTTMNGKQQRQAKNKNDVTGYALKADIKHYFDTVDHDVLITILHKHIKDKDVLWLVKIILEHHPTKEPGKGMPLGNWTSQFFANIYLNELDQYVKHTLKAKCYIRYVDDFLILHEEKRTLQEHQKQIAAFLATLKLELHPTKTKIIQLKRGIAFLGFKHFYHHKLILPRNKRKIKQKLTTLLQQYKKGEITSEKIHDTLQGWNAYAEQANTHKLREELTITIMEQLITT